MTGKVKELFNHLHDEHDLILVESEEREVEIIIQRIVNKALEEVEKSLPSDEEVEKEYPSEENGSKILVNLFKGSGIMNQRNKTQSAIDKLKEKI